METMIGSANSMASLIYRDSYRPKSKRNVANCLFRVCISTAIRRDTAKLALAATDAKMQDEIRGIVQRYLVKGVRIVHLAFEPYERRWWYTARLTEVKHQGVVSRTMLTG